MTPRHEIVVLVVGALATTGAFVSLIAFDGTGWVVCVLVAFVAFFYANVAQGRRYRRLRRSR